jgi:hypothetical protein
MEEGACGLCFVLSVTAQEEGEGKREEKRRIIRTCLVLLPQQAFWAGQIRQ